AALSVSASRRSEAQAASQQIHPRRHSRRLFGGWVSANGSKNRGLAPDAPDFAQSVAHLAHRDVRARGLDDRAHQVAIVASGVLFQTRERRFDRPRVAPGSKRLHSVDLLLLECRVDAQDLERPLVLEFVAVDADDDPLLRLDLGLVLERRLRDLALEEVLLDRLDDAAELLA